MLLRFGLVYCLSVFVVTLAGLAGWQQIMLAEERRQYADLKAQADARHEGLQETEARYERSVRQADAALRGAEDLKRARDDAARALQDARASLAEQATLLAGSREEAARWRTGFEAERAAHEATRKLAESRVRELEGKLASLSPPPSAPAVARLAPDAADTASLPRMDGSPIETGTAERSTTEAAAVQGTGSPTATPEDLVPSTVPLPIAKSEALGGEKPPAAAASRRPEPVETKPGETKRPVKQAKRKKPPASIGLFD